MNNISKLITSFTVCKFLEEVTDPYFSDNLMETLNTFSDECDFLGGNRDLFVETATRELYACRLFEDGMGVGAAPAVANNTTGIAGFKPDDLGVPVEAQERYKAKNSIFKRKKPNKYYMDQDKF